MSHLISNRFIGCTSIFLGLIFFSSPILLGFSSLISLPFLITGGVWVFVGIVSIVKDYSNSENLKLELSNRIQEIEKIVKEIKNSDTYLIYSNKKDILLKIENFQKEIRSYSGKKKLSKDFALRVENFLDVYHKTIISFNQNLIEKRKKEYSYLWKKDNIILDDEQQNSILIDDKYNLVVAAAGSGKTEVLITRIAYLIRRIPDRIKPNRILAIAYQRKAKELIEKRLNDQYCIDEVCVRTFHKLGKDILESSGRKIETTHIIDDNKKYQLIKEDFEEKIATNREFYELFVQYLKTIRNEDHEPTIEDKKAVLIHAQERAYICIDGTKVKSKAEKEIMDYLLIHKINKELIKTEYESAVGGFRPDFYLPQYDIFIEHWAIDQRGEVPVWFNQSSQDYKDLMEKKKKWFTENKRVLIETFAYEFNAEAPESFADLLKNRILGALEERFPQKEFEFTELTYQELLELVWNSQKTPIEDIQNFITIAKTYGLTHEKIAEKLKNGKWSNKQLTFGKLALKVFRAYQSQLEKAGKIDFEDMINDAIITIEKDENLCKNSFDHILIDEYQDINAQRLKLLKELLERNPNCKLFCVGDDWQSIMGFSGSNLIYFLNFSKYFENPSLTLIHTNYRSIKSIVDAGTALIRNNGKAQIQKITTAYRSETKPILVLNSLHKTDYDELYYEQTARDCLKRINEYLTKGYSPNDILIITRFMRAKIRGGQKFFKIVRIFIELAKEYNIKLDIDSSKETNAIRLITAHKSKGLEAKVVFILNMVNGEFGFPSEIEDDSILEIPNENNGSRKSIEEERRLFYVALTRAKEELYIYTRLNQKSKFLDEITNYIQKINLS